MINGGDLFSYIRKVWLLKAIWEIPWKWLRWNFYTLRAPVMVFDLINWKLGNFESLRTLVERNFAIQCQKPHSFPSPITFDLLSSVIRNPFNFNMQFMAFPVFTSIKTNKQITSPIKKPLQIDLFFCFCVSI